MWIRPDREAAHTALHLHVKVSTGLAAFFTSDLQSWCTITGLAWRLVGGLLHETAQRFCRFQLGQNGFPITPLGNDGVENHRLRAFGNDRVGGVRVMVLGWF